MTENVGLAAVFGFRGGKIGPGIKGPGDCGNSPRVWPNLCWRSDALDTNAPLLRGVA